jgi:hypothetical protein
MQSPRLSRRTSTWYFSGEAEQNRFNPLAKHEWKAIRTSGPHVSYHNGVIGPLPEWRTAYRNDPVR